MIYVNTYISIEFDFYSITVIRTWALFQYKVAKLELGREDIEIMG